MTELNYVQELLGTGLGTEGELLIPRKIHDTIIEEVDKALIPRSEAAMYIPPSGIPGSSYDINLITPNTMSVRVVPEAAEIPIDQVSYELINVRPIKYGVALRITRELLEDAKWNLLQHNISYIGKRFAENENTLVIAQLDTAANTVTGGAAITIANLTRGIQYLHDSDYTPTTLFIGMEVLNDLQNIDTFVEANKVGNTDMLKRGFLGTVYGLNVIKVSTNAGMTTTTSYITDKAEAYAIVEKRTITIENFELPSFDMSAAAATTRIAVKTLRTSAICKITTT